MKVDGFNLAKKFSHSCLWHNWNRWAQKEKYSRDSEEKKTRILCMSLKKRLQTKDCNGCCTCHWSGSKLLANYVIETFFCSVFARWMALRRATFLYAQHMDALKKRLTQLCLVWETWNAAWREKNVDYRNWFFKNWSLKKNLRWKKNSLKEDI